jgi:hypothetical protein
LLLIWRRYEINLAKYSDLWFDSLILFCVLLNIIFAVSLKVEVKMRVFILLQIVLLIGSSCDTNLDSRTREGFKNDVIVKDTILPELLRTFSQDELIAAMVCLGKVYETNNRTDTIIDLESLDSLVNAKNGWRDYYGQFTARNIDKDEDIYTWIQIYRLVESFINLKSRAGEEKFDESLTDYLLNKKEFRFIVLTYLQNGSTTDSLSYSQERLIFFDLINYIFMQESKKRMSLIYELIR